MGLKQLGQLAQQLVAGGMATGVIDDLELIQIHVAEYLLAALNGWLCQGQGAQTPCGWSVRSAYRAPPDATARAPADDWR